MYARSAPALALRDLYRTCSLGTRTCYSLYWHKAISGAELQYTTLGQLMSGLQQVTCFHFKVNAKWIWLADGRILACLV